MIVIKCCKDCETRTPGCHQRCITYLAEKARLEEIREEERSQKRDNFNITGFLKDNAERRKKRRR